MNTKAIIEELKQHNQDFEWYPTTEVQIAAIADHLNSLVMSIAKDYGRYNAFSVARVTDLCAGDGRVLEQLNEAMGGHIKLRAIEKSEPLLSILDSKNITVIGTDFFETNLVSKGEKEDVFFINPPYSEFELFINQALEMLSARVLYAVIPVRWRTSERIQSALKAANITLIDSVMESDFLSADRASRARVEVVCFSRNLERVDGEIDLSKSPPLFDVFVEDLLGIRADLSAGMTSYSAYESFETEKRKLGAFRELAPQKGIAELLIERYEDVMAELIDNYQAIGKLSYPVLKVLNVDTKKVVAALKERIEGEKRVFWKLLFDALPELFTKLSSTQSRIIRDAISKVDLDFTYKNIRYVVAAAARRANDGRDETIREVFSSLYSAKGIKPYVSNERIFTGEWRYRDGKDTKWRLDFRFIHSLHSCFEYGWSNELKGPTSELIHLVQDLGAVACLLGYTLFTPVHQWMGGCSNNTPLRPGDLYEIIATKPDGETIVLLTMRPYKNGSVHLKFESRFLLAFNVAAARLLGWVTSKQDYEAETGDTCPNDVWEESCPAKLGSGDSLLKIECLE